MSDGRSLASSLRAVQEARSCRAGDEHEHPVDPGDGGRWTKCLICQGRGNSEVAHPYEQRGTAQVLFTTGELYHQREHA